MKPGPLTGRWMRSLKPPEKWAYRSAAARGKAHSLLSEGVRWRNIRPWAKRARTRTSSQKARKIVELYTNPPPEATRWFASMSWGRLARALSLRLRDGPQTAIASKRPWNTAEARTRYGSSAPYEWRTASRPHIHLTLEKFQELPEATTKEDRAGYPTRPYLPDRR
jgi:hypothetical protein